MLPRPVRAFSSRTKSSTQWLQRQNRDIYVKQAKTAGFLSRAAYKLLHLNRVRLKGPILPSSHAFVHRSSS